MLRTTLRELETKSLLVATIEESYIAMRRVKRRVIRTEAKRERQREGERKDSERSGRG